MPLLNVGKVVNLSEDLIKLNVPHESGLIRLNPCSIFGKYLHEVLFAAIGYNELILSDFLCRSKFRWI